MHYITNIPDDMLYSTYVHQQQDRLMAEKKARAEGRAEGRGQSRGQSRGCLENSRTACQRWYLDIVRRS